MRPTVNLSPCAHRAGIFLLAALLCGAFALDPSTGLAAPSPQQQYEQALQMARDGDLAPAIDLLAGLAARFPDNRRYLHDYVVVLGWAERDEQVLDQVPRLEFDRAPAYVLEGIGKAARNLGRYALAIDAYRAALERDPGRAPARLGLALALTDSGAPQDALAELDDMGQNPDALNARAYALRSSGALFEALAAYERTLRLDPDNEAARRGRIMVTLRLGAPHLAADMAERNPGLLSAGERAAIERDRRAIDIRWARLAPADGGERGTGGVIAELEQALSDIEAASGNDAPEARRARFDLIVAHHEHGNHDRAVALYRPLEGAEADIPVYVLAAVANAQLARHEPEQARNLLEQAVNRQPEDTDLQFALFYAYVDTEDYDRALTLIDALAEAEPPWLGEPPRRRPNPDKLAADSTAALGRAFADRLAEAERRFDVLVAAAPHNADLRSERAFVYLWRGWPRRALEEFGIVLHSEPQHPNARNGRIEALQTLADYHRAERSRRALERDQPNHGQLSALARRWTVRRMRALHIRAMRGRSSGPAEGTDDLAMDTRLYNRPLDYHYRIFAHHRFERADFPEGRATYRRLGAGLEYRARDVELVAEVDRDAGGSVNAGMSLYGRWAANDHWAFSLELDSYSDEVPLRGRLAEDIDGRGVTLAADWRAHESRAIHAAAQSLDFSDDNRRRSLYLSGFQRLITGPHYKLDSRLELYTSRNTRNNAPYFNPAADFSTDVTLIQEWLLHRRYERSFRHRLATTAGRYRQRGFGTGTTWAARYEHEWHPGDRTGLTYGVTRARRIYDGAAEYQTILYLNLDWRF